jgi:hypothetical protein
VTVPIRLSLTIAVATVTLAGCEAGGGGGAAKVAASGTAAPAAIAAPAPALHLDPFYARYLDAGGIPVVASARVPPEALTRARDIVLAMLAHRPDLRRQLVADGARVGIIAADEAITDLPEHRGWRKPTHDDPRLTACELKHYSEIAAMSDRDYWNGRARGIGGLFTVAAAENLLATPGSRYFGENILVHEFSHAILGAIEKADPALYRAAGDAYAHALAASLWKGDYAGVTLQEYWAEGTQFWFNDNMLARLAGANIVSDADLGRYDPALAAVLERAYGRRHRIAADPFYRHPARLNVPVGYQSADC